MARRTARALSLRRRITSWRRDLAAWRKFWAGFRHYCRLAPPEKRPSTKHLWPCLGDDAPEQPIEPIYFYQDAWAFERIVQRRPGRHVDVGSHHKFVALLSKVVPVTLVDVRPLSLPMDSLDFQQGSILRLPFASGSIESLSSLCVVEHIGLGRYGEPLDPDGSEKAIAELKRVLKPGGDLYLSLNLNDTNRTYFNAHRAFAEDYVEQLLEPLRVLDRRYIAENSLLEQKPNGFCVGLFHLRR